MVSFPDGDPRGTGPVPGHERLKPGEHCRISESQWFALLQSTEPIHQWGSAFLVEEAAASTEDSEPPVETLVRAYWRDDSAAHRHTAWRFDASTSSTVRQTLVAIERAAEQVADLISQAAERGSSNLAEQRAEHEASDNYTAMAEDFYRELLRLGAASTDD
jgi:hypothetical protein